MIYIYTDGSCNNKTKRNGGCGIVLLYKDRLSKIHKKEISIGQYINTTSARMEIMAVLEALKAIKDKSIKTFLYCDNQYVVKSISVKWAYKWQSDNWIDYKTGKERVNGDLWKLILIEVEKFKDITFHWIKGHNENKYNEIADELAGRGGRNKNIIIDNR